MQNIKIEQFGESFAVQSYHQQSDTWVSAGYNGKSLFTQDDAESFANKLQEIHENRDKFK